MMSPIRCKAPFSAQEETKIRKVRSMQANGGFTFNFTKRFELPQQYRYALSDFTPRHLLWRKIRTGKRSSINGNIAYNENGSFKPPMYSLTIIEVRLIN